MPGADAERRGAAPQELRQELVREKSFSVSAATALRSPLPPMASSSGSADAREGRRGAARLLPLLSARTRKCIDAVASSEQVPPTVNIRTRAAIGVLGPRLLVGAGAQPLARGAATPRIP